MTPGSSSSPTQARRSSQLSQAKTLWRTIPSAQECVFSAVKRGTNLSRKLSFWCVFLPLSEFRVKVFSNFSLPVPRPSPQESAQSTAVTVPTPFPRPPLPTSTQSGGDSRENKDCHWASRGRGHRPPEWFVNGGRGGGGSAESREPDASSGHRRGSQALLGAPSRRPAAAGGRRDSRGPELREAGEAELRLRAQGALAASDADGLRSPTRVAGLQALRRRWDSARASRWG